jgi:hypothetical protein
MIKITNSEMKAKAYLLASGNVHFKGSSNPFSFVSIQFTLEARIDDCTYISLPDKAQLFSPNFFRNFLFCGAHNEFDKIYTVIYTLSGGKVMQTVKLFQNGRSQAVRLPKEFQFDGEDVYIQKHGKKIKRTLLTH